MTNKNKINDILDMIDKLQESLLALPKDMLLSIDARNNEAITEGMKFITTYNDNLKIFSTVSQTISEQIKDHFQLDSEQSEEQSEPQNTKKQGRIVEELDKEKPHSLDEDFTYKRPYGFVLHDKTYTELKNWRHLYMLVLDFLQYKDPFLFEKLPNTGKFISKRGNPLFAHDKSTLRVADAINDFYAEVNLSANDIIKLIGKLLDHFQIDQSDMRIYLREDRDA